MTERKQFSHLADKLTQYDYKGWAKGIQRSGYASSRKWSSQVLGIINKYNLNELDATPAPETNGEISTKQSIIIFLTLSLALNKLNCMRKVYYIINCFCIFTSCSAHKSTISSSKAHKNNQSIQKANKASIAS
jgi:hypothetical protein